MEEMQNTPLIVCACVFILGVGYCIGMWASGSHQSVTCSDAAQLELRNANLTAQLNFCVNATNQLMDPIVMTDGYGHFACCSKVGQCKAVPNFILNATNTTGE